MGRRKVPVATKDQPCHESMRFFACRCTQICSARCANSSVLDWPNWSTSSGTGKVSTRCSRRSTARSIPNRNCHRSFSTSTGTCWKPTSRTERTSIPTIWAAIKYFSCRTEKRLEPVVTFRWTCPNFCWGKATTKPTNRCYPNSSTASTRRTSLPATESFTPWRTSSVPFNKNRKQE